MLGSKANSTALLFLLAASSVTVLSAFTTGAEAKIRCEGAYQVTSNGKISTPYCEAENLARVAQSRGISTSGAAIRNNYGTLRHVCMVLRGDSRVSGTCDVFTESPY